MDSFADPNVKIVLGLLIVKASGLHITPVVLEELDKATSLFGTASSACATAATHLVRSHFHPFTIILTSFRRPLVGSTERRTTLREQAFIVSNNKTNILFPLPNWSASEAKLRSFHNPGAPRATIPLSESTRGMPLVARLRVSFQPHIFILPSHMTWWSLRTEG